MDENLRLHIKELKKKALFSMISALGMVIFIFLAFFSLFFNPLFFFIFAAIAAPFFIYFIMDMRRAKQEEKSIAAHTPVVLHADRVLSFEETVGILESITEGENRLSLSENMRFFRLNHILKFRMLLYHTDEFSKEEFDSQKSRMNKKANKILHISQCFDRSEARKHIRLNIICAPECNEALHRLLSCNALHNLLRMEGVIHIAIIGDRIILPPLCGDCTFIEIGRYQNTIKFLERVLLSASTDANRSQ